MVQRTPPSERPRTQPEIIPPERAEARFYPDTHTYYDAKATNRLYVARVGPFGLFLIGLGIVAVIVLLLVLVVGALLLWIPVVALLVGIGLVSGFLRRGRAP